MMAAMTSQLPIFQSGSIFFKFCTHTPPGVPTHNRLFSYCLKIKYGRHGRHFDFFPNICDDYSSRTINGRDMGFSPKGLVQVEEPPVSNLEPYVFQMAAMTSYVKRVSRQNSNSVKKGHILMKFDKNVHMGVLSDLILFSFSKKNQRWRL